MESKKNCANAFGYIENAKKYIRKKKLRSALQLSIKAYKLCPIPETKLFMTALKNKVELSNTLTRSLPKKSIQPSHENSTVDEGSSEDSSSSSDDDSSSEQSNESTDANELKRIDAFNKRQSLKFLQKAEQCIIYGKIDLAEKYVHQSRKVYPLNETGEFFKVLQELRDHEKSKYTEEQANVVKKVEVSESFYDIFDVNPTATVSEIKQGYTNLSLLLNPDKNFAPGAEEAFRFIADAANVLCDEDKRRAYDDTIFGSSVPSSSVCIPEDICIPEDVSNERYSTPANDDQFWSALDFFFDSDEYVADTKDDK